MPTISLTLPVAGTTITAGLHAANYTALQSLLNAGLDQLNFATGKIFDNTKIMQGGAVTGNELRWNGTSTTWVPDGGYATTLPGAPFDGQRTILVDSTAAPTYAWLLRFNATLTKWEFLGGRNLLKTTVPAAVINTLTQVGVTGNYRSTATDFTTPVAGAWWIQGNFRIDPNGGATGVVNLSAFSGAALADDANGSAVVLPVTTAASTIELHVLARVPAVAASTVIGLAVTSPTPGTHKIAAQNTAFWPDKLG